MGKRGRPRKIIVETTKPKKKVETTTIKKKGRGRPSKKNQLKEMKTLALSKDEYKKFNKWKQLAKEECAGFMQSNCISGGECKILNLQSCDYFDRAVKPLIEAKEKQEERAKNETRGRKSKAEIREELSTIIGQGGKI